MRAFVFKAGVMSIFLLLAAAPSRAQAPPPPPQSAQALRPVTGFVSAYEIVRTVRLAGFNPLAPPLREGTDYIMRATDFRGILMRVVVDARTAAIRDVTRIVPGPGRYGQFYAEPPFGPADSSAARMVPSKANMEPPLARPPAMHPAPALAPPPLPRPRPAALASRKADGAVPAVKAQPAPDAKARINSEVITTAPAPAAPKKAPVDVEPLND